MYGQKSEIRFKRIVSIAAKSYPFLLNKTIQKAFLNRHRIFDNTRYFESVIGMTKLGKPINLLTHYENELLSNGELEGAYNTAISSGLIKRKYKSYKDRIMQNPGNVVNYYSIIRELKPKVVIETGTASGSMTSWILAALNKNTVGKLVSIDIPSRRGMLTMDLDIEKRHTGYLIPNSYHKIWDLHFGDSKVLLPNLLLSNDVDLFIHDSLHTRTHMLFELNVARTLLKEGSIIVCDDILWNSAWFEFLRAHRLYGVSCQSNTNLGLTVNTFDAYERSIGLGIVEVV